MIFDRKGVNEHLKISITGSFMLFTNQMQLHCVILKKIGNFIRVKYLTMLNRITAILMLLLALPLSAQFGFDRSYSIPVDQEGTPLKFPWAGGMDYCQFSNIDLDFDGDLDLFVFDRTCDKIMTFIQEGEAGEVNFQYAPEYEEQFPENLVNWALLVDYDCDGLPDIFTSTLGGSKVFRNTGDAGSGHSFELIDPLLRTTIYGGETYMYFSSADIPAIVDVDGDSDMDVLAFGVLGQTVEYHKNLSMELYGVCDSLEFETKNICWGRFQENGASNEVTLWDTTDYPCRGVDFDDPEFVERPVDAADRHAGSTVLALDLDDSGVMDLVIGDASYSNLVMLLNAGTEVNSNSGMDYQETNFPSETEPVDLDIFPGAFYVDVNNDGNRDLIASPNSKIGSQNKESVWMYLNENSDADPTFDYQINNFLQEDMVENGTSSLPVFFDHNGDGLKDLLVSSLGQFNPVTGNLISKIAYYENVGTAELPAYEFVTDDYEDLSLLGIGESLSFYPTFGDLDGDGDEDMILGEYTGYCYYLENTGGAGSPAIFNTFELLTDGDGDPILESTFVFPKLVDLDRDGDEDLVLGRRSGKLHYYENTGTGTYNFDLVTTSLGDVDVSGAGFIEGYAVPEFIDIEGVYHLLVGSKRGFLYYYNDIDGNLDGSFNLVDSITDNIAVGSHTAPAVVNLTNDNRLELALGNRRGGVELFQSAPTSNIGLPNFAEEWDIRLYPNPASNAVMIELGNLKENALEQTHIRIYTILGNLVYQRNALQNSLVEIDVNQWPAGTYLIEITDGEKSLRKKLVVQK